MKSFPVYLDCNATTPLDPAVRDVLYHYLDEEYGNEGSRTHEYGARARQAVQKARDQVAAVVHARRDEMIFTSGATEANNLAILGLAAHGEQSGKKHLMVSKIEHKAVLEPVEELERRGFEVTWLDCDTHGVVRVEQIREGLRDDTLLVSVMAANNETGVRQPIAEVAEVLKGSAAYFHVDAAQAFGKDLEGLREPRIDLMAVSGHKVFAPKGIGALVARRRGYHRVPLKSLMFGGGQERGLRPGTLPVALVAAMGQAAESALRDHDARVKRCREIRTQAIEAFAELSPEYHGEPVAVMPHVLNVSFGGLDSEALMVALKDMVAISNGSACTSASYTPSHVLKAMGMNDDEANCAVRISWCHLTPDVDWGEVASRIQGLR